MNRDVLLGAGVVLAFIVLVNRAKKNEVTDTEGGGGGGGGGGGPIGGPFGPLLDTGTLTTNNLGQSARASNQGQVLTPIFTKDTSPTRAVTSSTEAKAIQTATNTGGIVPVAQGGSMTPTQRGSVIQISKADLEKGMAGNTVFKPFNGSFVDSKFLGFVGSTPKFEFN